MNYKIDAGFEDGTTVRIETSNRKLFFRIEQIINDFRNGNEEQNGFELANQNRNGLNFENENELGEKDRNGLQKSNGNEPELQIQNKPQNNSENEEKSPTNSTSISTKWGNAYLDRGYYKISSMKYKGQALHRLIYEDYHKCTIIYGHVHHIDGNKTNNNPENLILLTPSEHSKITQDMINYGNRKEQPLVPRISEKDEGYWEYGNQLSKDRNTTGYLRVYKQICPRCSQGFTYKYTWRENGKRKALESTDIKKLEAKVVAKGLPWKKL